VFSIRVQSRIQFSAYPLVHCQRLARSRRLARTLAAGALALACLGSGATTALADQIVSYQVQPGDTVWDVASQFGVTPGAIIADNALSPTGQLPIGQTIVINVPDQPATRLMTIERPRLDQIALTGDVSGDPLALPPGNPTVPAPPLPQPVAAPLVQLVLAPPVPAAPPRPAIIAAPYLSQLDGTLWGSSNCGPTSLAMALGALGVNADQMWLRHLADDQMGLRDPNEGTTWESLAYAAQINGVSSRGLYGSGNSYHTWSIDDLKGELAQGHPVLLLVRYWNLPGHGDSSYPGDHYILALGFDESGNLVFNDPASPDDGAGLTMSPDQLTRAWSNTWVGFVRTAMALSKS
jgi:LysM repeat protein